MPARAIGSRPVFNGHPEPQETSSELHAHAHAPIPCPVCSQQGVIITSHVPNSRSVCSLLVIHRSCSSS